MEGVTAVVVMVGRGAVELVVETEVVEAVAVGATMARAMVEVLMVVIEVVEVKARRSRSPFSSQPQENSSHTHLPTE